MEGLERSFEQELTKRQINELRYKVKKIFEEKPESERWDALLWASLAVRQRAMYRSLFLVHALVSLILLVALLVAIAL